LITGEPRFTYDVEELLDGVGMVPIMMGLFGISEILTNLEAEAQTAMLEGRISRLFPNLQDWKDSTKPILRGTALGFFIGILPGTGPGLISFLSYAAEKRCSKSPEKFGTGAIEGVAGPESANNAAVSGGFVPLFTLGIPANSAMAILLGAMLIHGLQPGPLILSDHPDLFWGVITSMYVGNCMLLALNLPFIPLWVQLLKVPYRILFPLILLFCLIGVYSMNSSTLDILVMIIFGVLGYVMRKLGYEAAPLIMTFILGPMWESSLRQSLLMSKGSFLVFLKRPISAVALILAFVLLFYPLFSFLWKKKKALKPSS
jgi:putative tricarboxylic transport membrane protein